MLFCLLIQESGRVKHKVLVKPVRVVVSHARAHYIEVDDGHLAQESRVDHSFPQVVGHLISILELGVQSQVVTEVLQVVVVLVGKEVGSLSMHVGYEDVLAFVFGMLADGIKFAKWNGLETGQFSNLRATKQKVDHLVSNKVVKLIKHSSL